MSEETPNQPAEEQTPGRLSYDAEFVKHTEEFCSTVLARLPEVQGLAIIPIWTHQPEKLPPGFLRLRAQGNLYMPELLKLLGLFMAFSVEVQKDFMGQVRILDNYLHEMTTKLQELQGEQTDTPTDAANNDVPTA